MVFAAEAATAVVEYTRQFVPPSVEREAFRVPAWLQWVPKEIRLSTSRRCWK